MPERMVSVVVPLVKNLHQEEVVQYLEALWLVSMQLMQNQEGFCEISSYRQQDSDVEQVGHRIVELIQARDENSNGCAQIFSFLQVLGSSIRVLILQQIAMALLQNRRKFDVLS